MQAHQMKRIAGSGGTTDPYFNDVCFLAHADGTNGAQNGTFIDSSTNGFTVNTSSSVFFQGASSPFSLEDGKWACSIGTINYNNQLNLRPESGDFTYEFWVRHYSTGSNEYYIDYRPAATNGVYVTLYKSSSDVLTFFVSSAARITGTTAMSAGVWYHVALAKSGSTTKLFLNGVQEGSDYNDSNNYLTAANRPRFCSSNAGTQTLSGDITNLRFVKGTAVYTSGFTPPTSPLTAITNTQLLIFQSRNFVDNSANAYLYSGGTPYLSASSYFAPLSEYSASQNGGSVYAATSAANLNIADSATIRFGTGSFTIQCWVFLQTTAARAIAGKGTSTTGWEFGISATNQLTFTDTTTTTSTTTTLGVNGWYHVAVVRSGTGANQLKLYINGVDSATGTSSTDFNQTNTLYIANDRVTGGTFNGFISGFKYSVGTAETITLPTAPPTGGTILLNFTNGAIFDSSKWLCLRTDGNAQIDTTTKKFGTGSMEFDGTGDYIFSSSTQYSPFLNGKFTIECWVYLATADIGSTRTLIANTLAPTTNGWRLSLNTTEKVVFEYPSSLSVTSSGSITLDQWNHIAVVKEGIGSNQLKIYINGTNDGTGTSSTSIGLGGHDIRIGVNDANANPMKGFIDEIRITRNVSRYTANFTPPARAFSNK